MTRADGYAGLLTLLGARPVGRGWDARCPVRDRHRNGDRSPSLRLWVGGRGELVARCLACRAGWPELLAATGTVAAEWWPGGAIRSHSGRISVGRVVDVYDYTDDACNPVAQKVRREPGFGGASKHCSWRRPLPPEARDAVGISPDTPAWVYGLDGGYYAPHQGDRCDWRPCRDASSPGAVAFGQVVPSLYRLPDLLSAAFEEPAFLVEGEKKAKLLAALRLNAVSPPHGASKWDGQWGRFFAGRKVVVLPDNDTPGLGVMDVAAGSLIRWGAAGVKVVAPGPLWDVPEGEDVADWLGRVPAADRRRALLDLIRRHPSYVAQVARSDRATDPGPGGDA